MMNLFDRIERNGVLPVISSHGSKEPQETFNAIVAGGFEVVEISCCLPASLTERIISQDNCCIGIGDIDTLEQCKVAKQRGAQFVSTTHLSLEIAQWCYQNDIVLVPACASEEDVVLAASLDIKAVKYRSETPMQSNAEIKIIAQGKTENYSELLGNPKIIAVYGDWFIDNEQESSKIVQTCKDLRFESLGYAFAHLGINCNDEHEAEDLTKQFSKAFNFHHVQLPASIFVSSNMEIMKSTYLGAYGHIAIRTINIQRAILDLMTKGYTVNMETAGYRNGDLISVYLNNEFGGFAVHLLKM